MSFPIAIGALTTIGIVTVAVFAIIFDINFARKRVVRQATFRGTLRREMLAVLLVIVLASFDIYLTIFAQ